MSKIFGDSIDSISELETIDNPYEHLDYSFRVEEKIKNCFKPYSLNFLRNEIKNLLEEISYEGKFKWESFREGIYEVIRDIPLVIEKDGQHILSFRCIKLSDKTKINFNDISLAVLVKGGDSFYIDSNDDIIEKDEFIPRSR
ncbi:MAG: hypothetical protein M0P05_01710 [Candidatus Colwellbacteria bacterium]|nr:hypothetical protein [Candidatus Colwellbacteria bacterium]